MPIRNQAVLTMANRRLNDEGLPGIHWVYGEFGNARMHEAWDDADAQFAAWVDCVDWERVAIEAKVRCLRAAHEASTVFDSVCGECLQQQLLTREH